MRKHCSVWVSLGYGVAIGLTLSSSAERALAQSQDAPQGAPTQPTPIDRAMALPYGTPLTPQQTQQLREQALRLAQPYYENGSQFLTLPKAGEPGADFFQHGAAATTVPSTGQPGADYFRNGGQATSLPEQGQLGGDYFQNGAQGTSIPASGQRGSEYFQSGAQGTSIPAPGQLGSEYFQNGAQGTSIPAPGQPGSEYFQNGSQAMSRLPYAVPISAPIPETHAEWPEPPKQEAQEPPPEEEAPPAEEQPAETEQTSEPTEEAAQTEPVEEPAPEAEAPTEPNQSAEPAAESPPEPAPTEQQHVRASWTLGNLLDRFAAGVLGYVTALALAISAFTLLTWRARRVQKRESDRQASEQRASRPPFAGHLH